MKNRDKTVINCVHFWMFEKMMIEQRVNFRNIPTF